MIDSVRGTVLQVDSDSIVLGVGGIGLRVEISPIPADAADSVVDHKAVTLYTVFSLAGSQELQPRLYGFETLDARRLFLLLRSVSGVGSGTAMRLVGSQPTSELVQAIADGEVGRLKVKGVGKKTSERIVLELQKKAENFFSRG